MTTRMLYETKIMLLNLQIKYYREAMIDGDYQDYWLGAEDAIIAALGHAGDVVCPMELEARG